ncbi:hypothetical protein JVX90_14520 [Gordonia sp. PDNC005]|uniref:hypothetical protein n=1 Tax=Gordonia sp. PDNC005 TaxID=2811424 RepID=UPI001966C9DB|nr:hypothetical protein [Gordonia sp. PDNC005]QRY61620.1 hypothetical protein JVX90_14520 [Gordonia sp. PDNC005]
MFVSVLVVMGILAFAAIAGAAAGRAGPRRSFGLGARRTTSDSGSGWGWGGDGGSSWGGDGGSCGDSGGGGGDGGGCS